MASVAPLLRQRPRGSPEVAYDRSRRERLLFFKRADFAGQLQIKPTIQAICRIIFPLRDGWLRWRTLTSSGRGGERLVVLASAREATSDYRLKADPLD